MDTSDLGEILGPVLHSNSTLESILESKLESLDTPKEDQNMSTSIPWVARWDTPMSNAQEESMGTPAFDPWEANMEMPAFNPWEARIEDPVFDPWVESMDTSPEPSDTEEGRKDKGKGVDPMDMPSEPLSDEEFVPSFEEEEMLEIGPSNAISSSHPVRRIEILSPVNHAPVHLSVSAGPSVSRTPSASSIPSASRTPSAAIEPSASPSRSPGSHGLRSNPQPSRRLSEDKTIHTPSEKVPRSAGSAIKWESWELALLMITEDWVTLHQQWIVDWVMVAKLMELTSAVLLKKFPGLPSRRRREMVNPYQEVACHNARRIHKHKDPSATYEQLPWIVQTLVQDPDWVVFTLCLHLNHHASDNRPYHSAIAKYRSRFRHDQNNKTRHQNLHERHVAVVQQNFSYLVSCEDCRAWYDEPDAGQDPLQEDELLVLHHASRRPADRHYPEWLKTMCNHGWPLN